MELSSRQLELTPQPPDGPGRTTAKFPDFIGAAAEGELSDADLERVAGGKQDITANCLVLGGTAVSNTVMQLNL